MNMGTAARVFGVGFLLAGISGFFPSPIPPGAPPLVVAHGYGLALGMLPVNVLHNVVHLAFGALGLMAGFGAGFAARTYFQIVAVVYALLAVMGLIPATHTTFGLVPIYGNDVWFHAVIAALAAYFGFAAVPAVRTGRVR